MLNTLKIFCRANRDFLYFIFIVGVLLLAAIFCIFDHRNFHQSVSITCKQLCGSLPVLKCEVNDQIIFSHCVEDTGSVKIKIQKFNQ